MRLVTSGQHAAVVRSPEENAPDVFGPGRFAQRVKVEQVEAGRGVVGELEEL